MDFEKICTIFTMQEPYYGILLSAMDRFPTNQISTIGVCRSGNVFRLGYNPEFIEDKDLNTMMAILKHECIHIAFNHFTIWDDQNPSEAVQKLRNIACDLETNCYVDFSNTQGLKPLLVSDYGWEPRLGSIEYFNRLLQLNQQQQQAQAKSPNKPCNGGLGGQNGQNCPQNQQPQPNQDGDDSQDESEEENSAGNSVPKQKGQNGQRSDVPDLSSQMEQAANQSWDDHSMWPDDMTEEQMENLKQQIDDLCVFAAEEVEKGRGTLPGEMEGRIKLIRDRKKPKPIADWKKYFRRYIGNEFSDQIKKSRKRESLRFPDAAGNRHRRKSHILVAIDTSGSVSMPEYREFFGQLKTMKDITFHVVECDSEIQFEYDFHGKIRDTLHGGGGTSFQPPVDMYNQNRRKYEGLVYFTDGEADIPKDTPKETLWVISSRGRHDRTRYLRNGASVVFIPKPNKNA